ncbi:MAG: hypothetical protein ABIH23_31490, partial [bacterium]
MLYFSKFTGILLLSLPIVCPVTAQQTSQKIPFPEALDDASIRLPSLSRIVDDALIIGNGDINALIYSEDGAIVMNLTKNDVWDARLETENDPPIPTLDLIKQLGASETGFPLKNNNSSVVLPEGETWTKKDSYHTAAYPCPRQCARVVLGERVFRVSEGHLDLRRAVANVSSGTDGPPATAQIRALADRNAFLIDVHGPIHLLPVRSEGIPEPEVGERDGVSWIKQVIPGDPDWSGMEFAVAAAFNETGRKTVAIVT